MELLIPGIGVSHDLRRERVVVRQRAHHQILLERLISTLKQAGAGV
jgi:hypothetical protein